jgi:LacI family transcriptional regulator
MTRGLIPLVGPGREYDVVDPEDSPARVLERLLELKPEGVIMEFRPELTEPVASLGYPLVLVMADMLMEGIGSVNVDDYAVGSLAADYLWRKGLRRFGFFGRETLHAPERRTGFVDRLAGKGRPVAVLEVGDGPGGRRARGRRLDQWLLGLERPAGIFAAHDPLGRDVLEAAGRLGLRVPEDLAVLSASNDQVTCELVYPGISSVEIPWEELGRQAGLMLEARLRGEPPAEPLLVRPRGIRTRQSTDFYRVSDGRVQRAVTYMQAHLEEELDIGRLVRAVGVDRRALERLFRKQLNRSPKQVLTDMRSERARELLEQSDLRVGEIAERCGFGVGEKLTQAFRKRYGQTPRDWRRGD